ncbi:MAG: efflux RND transporter periplasmic adaptor subunit [Flavobacteriaceae bacterium]
MKNGIYMAIAAIVGLGLGYLLFGTSGTDSSDQTTTHDHALETKDQLWTCSMHPQIMQSEPGDCPICGMDLIPAKTTVDGLTPEQFKMTDNALALANVQTTVVGNVQEGGNNTFSVSGKIAVNVEAMAVQASYFDGRIEQLNVNHEGQDVRKGQLLATIYSPELIAAQQELLTAVSLQESQPQLYRAVRNKLRLWKLSEKQINSIENRGEVTENFPVYATVSGTVSQVMGAQGDYVKKGQPIVKVSDLNTVWAEFDAYESQLSLFGKGQHITITTNAYPNNVFAGRITFIDPVLNQATRTVTVRATLDNREGLFKPGMFVAGVVEAETNTSHGEGPLLVPSSAVMWTGERSLVYVKVKPDEPVFEMREVQLGVRNGESIEITSGLRSGEEIVTHGTFTVDAAAQLQGKKSMMNKSGGRTMTGHEGHMEGGMAPDSKGPMKKMGMAFPKTFRPEFETVLTAYMKLKDALVVSDARQAAMYAQETFDELKKMKLSLLEDGQKTHLNNSMEMLKSMATEENLGDQRAHFVMLNENMVAMARSEKVLPNTLFVQRCPMANNNKGALWLSREKEIRNPYFGDAMLTCGSVVTTP